MNAATQGYATSLYEVEHGLLSIYLTNRCNLRCRHCSTGSSPSETSFLNLDGDTMSRLRQGIDEAGIKGIHVSGGEPFLRREDLRKLAALALEKGVLMAINSNGFWGNSLERATSLLGSMPGITELILSTDAYHAEYLSPGKLIVAAQAALACDLLVSVVSTTPGGRPSAWSEQFDEDLRATGIRHQVRHLYQVLGPTARAQPLAEVVQFMSAELPPGRCDLLNRPTLLENGRLHACCNTTTARTCQGSPLDLGDMASAPLARLLRDGRERKLLQAMRRLGPAVLAAGLTPPQRALLPARYPRNDICALCTELMTSPANVATLEHALEAGSMKLLFDAAGCLIDADAAARR